jgi:hypothetical protein
VRRALAAAALVLFAAALPLSAMELVIFQSERSIIADRCEESGDLVILILPGGGKIGVPRERIRERYAGFVLPVDEPEPQKFLPPEIPYRDIVAKYCQQYQMDWKLVAAVIRVESNFNPKAVSPKGAQGLMQLMPSVQKDEGVTDAFDPDQNVRAGVHFLKKMLDAFEGDLELGLAAYNAGLSRVQAKGAVPNIAETKAYVARILTLYPTLGGEPPKK